jgi:hypothetical protein
MPIGCGNGVAVGVNVTVGANVGVDDGVGVNVLVGVSVSVGAGVLVGSPSPTVQAEMIRIRAKSSGKDFFISKFLFVKRVRRRELLPPWKGP